jgi:hypothetical protein
MTTVLISLFILKQKHFEILNNYLGIFEGKGEGLVSMVRDSQSLV